MRVNIVGLSDSTRHLIGDGELWCLGWDREFRYVADRVFEMHDEADLRMTWGDGYDDYVASLEDCRRLVTAKNYPFDWVAEVTGAYWCSSIAYMLALAVREGCRSVGLYGVDMTDDYGYQRPNTEYLIGVARGRGTEVVIPPASPLCKFQGPPDREYLGRYGRLA